MRIQEYFGSTFVCVQGSFCEAEPPTTGEIVANPNLLMSKTTKIIKQQKQKQQQQQ
jgi:hypothetical protein